MANLRDDGRAVGTLDAFKADANGTKERQAENADDENNGRESRSKGVRGSGKEINKRHGHDGGPFTFAAEALKRAHSVAVG
ncbi:hypothetical protein [Streptomyces sp. NPDC102283]|uniref:hypothetical protein n=1 Tax=Streptomyces sp. NPDC102283 TaxID=3366155 RepID=UPI0037FC6833